MIGTPEIVIISGVVILLFGASALPKFARSVGNARKEFELGMKEAKEIKKEADAEKKPE